MTLLKGEDALTARRHVGEKLTRGAINALQSPRRLDKPDWALMQQLHDAGFESDPISGAPVYDPSKCSASLLTALWRAYCGVADTINTKELGQTGEALDDLHARLREHAGGTVQATQRCIPRPVATSERRKRCLVLSEDEATDVDEGDDGKRRRVRHILRAVIMTLTLILTHTLELTLTLTLISSPSLSPSPSPSHLLPQSQSHNLPSPSPPHTLTPSHLHPSPHAQPCSTLTMTHMLPSHPDTQMSDGHAPELMMSGAGEAICGLEDDSPKVRMS